MKRYIASVVGDDAIPGCADINGDGMVDVRDIPLLKRIIAGSITEED